MKTEPYFVNWRRPIGSKIWTIESMHRDNDAAHAKSFTLGLQYPDNDIATTVVNLPGDASSENEQRYFDLTR